MDRLTEDLPFLVVHGAWISKALIAAGIAAVLGAIWLVRRLRGRAATRAALAGVARGARGDGEAVLRGTLRGTAAGPLAATLRAEGYHSEEPLVASWRTGELWVETDDGRVVLDGEVRVAAGSRAAAARNGVPAAVGDAHLEAARAGAPWLHRIRWAPHGEVLRATVDAVERGDRVVVRGRLEPAPSAEPSGYREAEVAWVMRAPEAGTIELAACAPRTAVPRAPRELLVVAAACALLVSWGGLDAAGEAMLERCEEASAPAIAGEPLELPGTHACAIAAAMPGSRDDALVALTELLDRHPYRDERSVRRLIGASSLHEDCRRTASRLLAHARLEDAGRLARACGDRRTEHAALVAQGRFDAASDVEAPADRQARAPRLPLVSTLIAAGRWAEAASAVDERAAEAGYDDPRRDPSRVRHDQCLAEMLRAFGGDLEAPGRLRALDAEAPGECAPMLAELAPPEERRRLLLAARDSSAAERIRWAAGLSRDAWSWTSAEEMLAEPEELVREASRAWLVAAERAGWPELGPEHRAELLRWVAVGQVLDGQIDAAMETALDPRAQAPAPDRPQPYQPHLASLVALFTPATNIAPELLREEPAGGTPSEEKAGWRRDWVELRFGRLLLRNGGSLELLRYYRAISRMAFEAAHRGDGEPLATALVEREWREGDVIALLPRLRTGREAVARQAAWLTSMRYEQAAGSVLELALHAALRREMLKLGGLPGEAARWAEIYRRFDAALDDRRRMIALMLSGQ